MEELKLVSSVNSYGRTGQGRPMRKDFRLRKHNGFSRLYFPSSICAGASHADFLMSTSGFGIRFHQDGQRKIFKGRTTSGVSVPKDVMKHLENLPCEIVSLMAREMPRDTWFFPFIQFLAFE